MATKPHPPTGTHSDERLDFFREHVVEAGLEVLDKKGLGLRAESITYNDVFKHLEEEHGIRLTRSSVHGRIWSCQDEFRSEVLSAAASHTSPYQHSTGMHEAIVTILTRLDELGLDHRQRVQAFCRVAGRALLHTYLESDDFRRFQAIKAAARPDDPHSTAELRSLVREKIDGSREERLQRFGFMFEGLGMRPRPELGMSVDDACDLFFTLVQILVAGAHLDHHAGFETMASTVETDLPADERWPWTYMGFAYLALVQALFEEDPDAQLPPPGGYPTADEIARRAPSTTPPPDIGSLVKHHPRRSKQELRDLVVAAGVQLFLRDGLRLKAEPLSYTAVFAHLKETKGITVYRSTVHQKIWDSQDEFRAEVLAEAARYAPGETLVAVREAMAAQGVPVNADGSVNFRQMILDNLRAMVSARMSVATTSPTFRRWQSIKASMLSGEPSSDSDGLRRAVSRQYEDMLGDFYDTCRSLFPLAGLEINPELRMDDEQAYHVFNVICATMATGFEYNTSAGARLPGRTVSLPRADGSGDSDEWPIPAVGSLAVLDMLFVPTC